jgi:hypothetical protein
MPAHLSHPPQMPEPARRAQRATAAPTRAVALRYLLVHPGSTANEIAAATGITAVHPALIELECLGFVHGDVPTPRNGRTVRYTVSRDNLREALDIFTHWVMADDQT